MTEPIPASRCERCGRVCAPPAHFCPDDASPMAPAAGDGEILAQLVERAAHAGREGGEGGGRFQ